MASASSVIEYEYDGNGNLTKDLNKNIVDIEYNILNLPNRIAFGDNSYIEYTYAADGTKSRTKHVINGVTTTTDYCGTVIYENGALKRILTEGGYIANGTHHFYLQDHLGNNRVVARANGEVIQNNHFYPFGLSFYDSANETAQPYQYNGKELDLKKGLNLYDYGARQYDGALGRFMTMDPMAEKYYSMSPYAYCANNPINYIDLHGDSLTLVGGNVQEIITAIYHGLEDKTSISMKFNNGVLDPTSIAEQASNTSDVFLQDMYEIAINPTMVELSFSNNNTYMMNGQKVTEEFAAPYDVNTSEFGDDYENLLRSWGQPLGKSINGNLGQTLIPGNVSTSGKSSTNGNVQVIVNSKGSLNHRAVGLVHEFAHVVLYMRGQPYGHPLPEVDEFVYGRATIMSKRLGYDF
ncbi:RHS repeat-associated core domain-containing protein [Bacteroides sp. UBA939]|uniref:RHS repeat domain-containing protein n=1 Tax=Bacteroides sp. UBA939 TaxID=1946092 RepID=UPI0032E50A88